MESSVKGIRYTYQVNLFNQVPTTVRSQIHKLPPVSEMSATPIDHYERAKDFLPPVKKNYETDSITKASPDLLQPVLRNQNPDTTKTQRQLAQPAINAQNRIEPKIFKQVRQYRQQQIAIPSRQVVTTPADSQAPKTFVPKTNDTNEADLFVKTNRSYHPDGRSFLQKTGLEPQSKTPAEQIRDTSTGTNNNSPAPVLNQPQKIEPTATANQPDLQANVNNTPGNILATGIDYLNKKGNQLYQLMNNTSLLMHTNSIDYYF